MAIHPNITRADYDALPGINWSALKMGIGKTAEHIKAAKRGRKDTAAFRFGRAFHTAILQPSRMNEWTTVDAKTTTNPNAITTDELIAIGRMQNSINRLPPIAIRDTETAITWIYGGVECKGLIDGTWRTMVLDLKSTQNAEPAAFKGEIFKHKYHGQLAFYTDGMRSNGVEITGAAILAVEKADPYAAALYRLSPSWLDLGRTLYEEALEVWADDKPATYGEQELEVPDWCDAGLRTNEDGGIDLS